MLIVECRKKINKPPAASDVYNNYSKKKNFFTKRKSLEEPTHKIYAWSHFHKKHCIFLWQQNFQK